MKQEPTLPLVSVCCITYNHEAYLAQAIESVLAQQTAFAVEMVIGEDCSTDGTRQLALDYQARFPHRVRVLAHAQNQGVMRNLLATLAACTGRYIALLDGDDYWTDPLKLQRQVNLLEAQPGCVLCVHDAQVLGQDASAPPYLFSARHALLPAGGGRISQTDLVRLGWGIPTASMVFRGSSLRPLPDWLLGVFSGDYALQLLSTCHGYAYYLPAVMSAYRLHAGGVSRPANSSPAHNDKRIFETKQFKRLLPQQPQAPFDKTLEELYAHQGYLQGIEGNRLRQWAYYWQALNVNRRKWPHYLLRLAKWAARMHA